MKVAVVGAGIAGLCAAVYARRCGFEAELIEMEHSSGGLATNWKRGDYTFENCLHWLLGSNPSSQFYSLWKEVFDIDQLRFVDSDESARIETEQGQSITMPRNVDRLESELLRAAPEDSLAIKRLVRGIRKLRNCELPVASDSRLTSLTQAFRMVPYLPEIRYWSRLTSRELGGQFQNPLLREFFSREGQGEMSAIALVFSLAWMSKKDAGYPIGGSQAVIQSIERKFRELGGQTRFHSKVKQIIVENDQAVGVALTDGGEIRADWVISAADGHTALFDWIPDRYRDEKAEAPYKTLQTFPSYLQVSLGVKRDLRQEPGFFTRILNTPISVDPGTTLSQLSFRVFHFDPTFAPAGKTAVTCFMPTYNGKYWMSLHQSDPKAYAARKQEIAETVIEVLERRIPGVRRHIEVLDVSTPVSVIRHTGNWKGSMEGFLLTPKTGFKPLRMKLPRLRSFMMIGQWVMPGGGLPSGLMTGRRCIQAICKAEHRPFVPSASSEGEQIESRAHGHS